MTQKDPKLAKDIAKKLYEDLKQKQNEKLIPNQDKFNKAFDEIFK